MCETGRRVKSFRVVRWLWWVWRGERGQCTVWHVVSRFGRCQLPSSATVVNVHAKIDTLTASVVHNFYTLVG